jgi:hypothetical protein
MMTMGWQDALQDAIHESDPQIMDEKIRAAETAIFARMRDFSSRPDSLEEQALLDALKQESDGTAHRCAVIRNQHTLGHGLKLML